MEYIFIAYLSVNLILMNVSEAVHARSFKKDYPSMNPILRESIKIRFKATWIFGYCIGFSYGFIGKDMPEPTPKWIILIETISDISELLTLLPVIVFNMVSKRYKKINDI